MRQGLQWKIEAELLQFVEKLNLFQRTRSSLIVTKIFCRYWFYIYISNISDCSFCLSFFSGSWSMHTDFPHRFWFRPILHGIWILRPVWCIYAPEWCHLKYLIYKSYLRPWFYCHRVENAQEWSQAGFRRWKAFSHGLARRLGRPWDTPPLRRPLLLSNQLFRV